MGDASVDVVISNCVLNLSGDRPRVLAEALRVLRPGGRVMISDLLSDRAVPDFIAASKESLVGCLPVQVAEYEADLADAGFAEVAVEFGRPYPSRHILADPRVRAVIEREPWREGEVRDFVESIHGGAIAAVKRNHQRLNRKEPSVATHSIHRGRGRHASRRLRLRRTRARRGTGRQSVQVRRPDASRGHLPDGRHHDHDHVHGPRVRWTWPCHPPRRSSSPSPRIPAACVRPARWRTTRQTMASTMLGNIEMDGDERDRAISSS